MPGRRIGQPGVDLAGEFVSALPEIFERPHRRSTSRLQNSPTTAMPARIPGPRPRHVQHIVHSAAIGCRPQGQGRRVLGAAGRRETWGRRPAM